MLEPSVMKPSENLIVLGIDATNLRGGGGFNHLVQLMKANPIVPEGFSKVVIWTHARMARELPKYAWLDIVIPKASESALAIRLFWQQFGLPKELKERGCHLLFSPGGNAPRFCSLPTVVMSQNMLPFEKTERQRYPWFSFQRQRLRLLRLGQSRSFSQSTGLIFLSSYAKRETLQQLSKKPQHITIIPHGVDQRFFHEPRPRTHLMTKSEIRVIYPSTVDLYKHQWNVLEAVQRLRDVDGLNITVDFAGGGYAPAIDRLKQTQSRLDPKGVFSRILGEIPFQKLHESYPIYDLLIYASSCENLPNIVLEAMASGIPILSSNRGPMPELLENGAVFFDPLNVDDLVKQFRVILKQDDVRESITRQAFEKAKNFSWEKCACDTFAFIRSVALSSSSFG